MALRGVGIDVADVSRLTRLVERGERFTSRWFTPDEVAECAATADPVLAYAARFAAKEAVWKALGVPWDGPVPWRSIAVLDVAVRPKVVLSDAVAESARVAGVGSIAVTISTAGTLATAVALAEHTR